MRSTLMGLVALSLSLAAPSPDALASGGLLNRFCRPGGHCAPSQQIVKEVVYQDAVQHSCKKIPETKKKWVYSWEDAPFCIADKHHGGCPGCAGPHCRKVLVKKQVIDPCPHDKCVVESTVVKVPVEIHRKVPCAPATHWPGEMIPGGPVPGLSIPGQPISGTLPPGTIVVPIQQPGAVPVPMPPVGARGYPALPQIPVLEMPTAVPFAPLPPGPAIPTTPIVTEVQPQ